MSVWLTALLPVGSVLLGAGITYMLNVRTRRQTKAEDAFHDAIAATAEALASREFVNQAQWDGATPDELAAFTLRANREALEAGIHAIGKARVALARASAYDPELQAWLAVPAHQFIEAAAAPALDRLRQNLGQRAWRSRG